MLFYGDHSRQTDVHTELALLIGARRTLTGMAPGIERHAALVDLFLRAAELAQGIADAEFEQAGVDRLTPAQADAGSILLKVAAALCTSWENDLAVPPPKFDAAISRLEAQGFARSIHCRRQEGFAFYGLYPEAYLSAARSLDGQIDVVIGIRSIGIGLAAIVAVTTSASTCISVRPVGPPFRRSLALCADFRDALAAHAGSVAIVDEGPGLSGSSFAAVIETLDQLGVAYDRMHVFPSHQNPPGSAADAAHLARWRTTRKHVCNFEDLLIDPSNPHHSLAGWCADITGQALSPLEDIGGGLWRRYRPGAPAQPMWERRKYLLRSERGCFLLRFAGLGRYGAETFRRAELLASAGFTPRVFGLRHGFLVEEWLEDARPIEERDRTRFFDRFVRYLAFRARHMPAVEGSGATLQQLVAMLVRNAGEGIGASLSAERWLARAAALERRVHRIQTDNKLQLWEWLCTADGRILKTDGYDHCAGHDLVGCQDLAWDIAAALCEFDLSETETEMLLQRLSFAEIEVDCELVALLRPCYVAFQLGSYAFSTQDLDSANPEQKPALDLLERYKHRLWKEIRQREPSL